MREGGGKIKNGGGVFSFFISSPALSAEPFGLQDSTLIAKDGLRAWEI